MGTHCSIRCIDDPNSEINQILDMDKEELESSIKRLEDLGYLIIYSTIIFNNNLEIV
jgi:DNA-binding Lrp family transcriptional regulator